MNESNLLHTLGQASSESAGEVFRTFLRASVLDMISQVMAEEVASLCGKKYQPSTSDLFRAGSTPGKVIVDGQFQRISRPRVRKKRPGSKSEEVTLETYQTIADPAALHKSIIESIIAGVSTREVKNLTPEDSTGVSKSSVSRLWKNAGTKFVDQLRSEDIASRDWLVLMIDGIRLSKDQTAIVAIGITAEGTKHVLDFALGSSENFEVCRDLLSQLIDRGLDQNKALLAVLDGSKALSSATKEFFPRVIIQRCLVHKERNIKGKLSRRHWGKLAKLFGRLRSVQGMAAAKEALKELESFLKPINSQGLKSLQEAGEELIALHSLEVPNTLHRSLLSTNAIENSFRNTRRKLGRVCRFRAETDQASRWLAYALLEAEKGFRKIAGHKDLWHLKKALQDLNTKGTPQTRHQNEAGPMPSPSAPATALAP